MTRNTPELDERFKNIIETLIISVSETGYPPARRTFVEKAGISSSSEAQRLLGVLEKRGFITVDHGVARGIRPNLDVIAGIATRLDPVAQNALTKLTNMVRFPIAGRIVASAPVPIPESPVSYFDSEHFVEVARSMLPSRDTQDLYALEVQGDSMIDALVNDGDVIILKRTPSADNGDMVAVWLVDKEETTLKHFYREKNRIRLQPANPRMKPLYYKPENVQVQGKVMMVYRAL